MLSICGQCDIIIKRARANFRALFFVGRLEQMPKRAGVNKVVEILKNYTEQNRDCLPILRECCVQNDWDYEDFCKMMDESPKVKRAANMLLSQKEVNLEKFAVLGSFNKPMSAFLLERMAKGTSESEMTSSLRKLDLLLDNDADLAHRLGDENNLEE
jgi:hypothetical protein